jgi:nitric oxide reductase subunit C
MLSKNQARTFFLGGTVLFFLIFLVLSWHTLAREVPKQTHEENLTPAVIRGKILFDENNCMGCHTILGEGAYYAPELTKVIDRKGADYCRIVLKSTEPWQPRGRKMVAYSMTDEEADDMIAFLTWIGEMDLNGFPPEPDLKKFLPTE